MSKQVVLEFPTDLPKESLEDKEALNKGKETIILEFLRKSEITQEKATELLGISKHDLLDLMAEHDIPMASFFPKELQSEKEEGKDVPQKISFAEALTATAGGWKDTIDCEELIKNIYADRLISTRPEVKL